MHKYLILPLLIVCMALHAQAFKFNEYLSADEIMAEVEAKHAADSEIELIKINIINNTGQNDTRKILSIIKRNPSGHYNYFIRFIEPETVKGVMLLMNETGDGDSEQFLYLPALGSVKEITGSGKANNFMGTDFSFEDLRKEKGTEYLYHRQLDTTIQGRDCYVILSAPADDIKMISSGYSSRLIYVEKTSFKILRIEFMDANEELSKSFDAYDYNSVEVDGPTARPRRAVMTDYKKGSTSTMVVLKSRVNFDIDPNLFTVDTLKSWTPQYTQMYMDTFNFQQ